MGKNNIERMNLHSDKDDWNTPKHLFKYLDDKYHFTLDPCSTHENALCQKHYTKEDDGLIQDWSNEIVFMNPPYGTETGKWIKKAYQESLNNAVIVCLIPARPDTKYWQDIIFPYASEIRFIRGRLHFSDSKNPAGFPSALVVFDLSNSGHYAGMTFDYKEK